MATTYFFFAGERLELPTKFLTAKETRSWSDIEANKKRLAKGWPGVKWKLFKLVVTVHAKAKPYVTYELYQSKEGALGLHHSPNWKYVGVEKTGKMSAELKSILKLNNIGF